MIYLRLNYKEIFPIKTESKQCEKKNDYQLNWYNFIDVLNIE